MTKTPVSDLTGRSIEMRNRILPLTTLVFAASLVALNPSALVTPIGVVEAAPQKGKPPPPPPPPPSIYSASFGPSMYDDPASTGNPGEYDSSLDGLKPAGFLSLLSASLSGSISGPNGYGNFKGTIAGAVSGLTITGVAELPDWFDGGDPCQDAEIAELVGRGLVASPLDGDLSMTFTELTGSLKGTPHITWSLTGAMDNQGATWSLEGHSGRSRTRFFPVYEAGSTPANLIVTVEGSVIDFVGPFTVLKCRADYTLSLVKVS